MVLVRAVYSYCLFVMFARAACSWYLCRATCLFVPFVSDAVFFVLFAFALAFAYFLFFVFVLVCVCVVLYSFCFSFFAL